MLGWIKIHREIQSHWIFKDANFYKWWSIILFSANHTEKKITLGYSIYIIKTGQCAYSIRTWSNLLDCSTKQVLKFFSLLESDGMITKKTLGKGKQSTTLINIDNYSKYQHSTETQGTTQGTTQRKREGGTTKEGKELKEEKEKYKLQLRETEFKNSLQPFLEEFGKDLLNEFYLYWTEKKPKGRKMRFEMQKTFDINRRLDRWRNNNFNKIENLTANQKLDKALGL